MMNLESRAALEHGFQIERGGAWLDLTDEQHHRLK
jgi:hypothetical protein